ncbi:MULTISPECIES: glutathione S-transferase family protein [unclassified Sphingomonas]|uniref:glutathione S-transferase family protein n=1 Tax=unclassified Sphingomonas TaxID=196159 RepID=UPI0017836C99|nr:MULTISPECIES: glutathione S-transferase family protein [unclassified Sphingomonas]MBD8699145.1 glutathione S-transferase family protein [Sphingomonas sp. CFBP 13714]MBD8736929.1 glutathione S-transferase family protein [Sphingomonas sp. CFBP 13706]MBP2513141.1 glutathione S-transferase [Sphingomonas sp. PvP018]
MTLTLYSNPMSRGRIARWMLEETGAAYDTVMLDYATTMKAAPYLSVNPMGKVPAIVHDGHVVTECGAICAYLADAVPEAQLAPTADERADYYRWLFYAAGPLEAAITNRSLGVVPTETQQRMVGYGSFEAAIAGLEHAVAAHSYIAGERFTAADVYVGAQVIWGLQFGTMPKLAAFEAYAARLTERAAHRRAAALDDDAMAKMAS